MHRRRILALLGTTCFGGCIGSSPAGPETTTVEETTMTSDRTTPDPPELGVPNPETCPPFDSNVKRVVCSSDVGDDAPLVIDPADQFGSLPRAEFDFTLGNEMNATFETNFYGWSVWKRVEEKWYNIAPRFVNQPLMRLRPGDSHEWHLTVDNADLDRPIPHSGGTRDVTVVGLGAGTYAFGIDGWFEGQTYEDKTGVAARFELTGDQLELTPVGIDRAERDGDTVVVHDESEGNDDRGRYVVTRIESAPEDPSRMITEQVVRETPLRNALAHFESRVRQVRLEAETTTFPAFGVNGTRYVEYEGETYSVKAERLDAETADS